MGAGHVSDRRRRQRFLGAPLTIALPRTQSQVRILYETVPTASGLQWLSPAADRGKEASLPVHAIGSNSRQELDSDAGFTRRAGDVFRNRFVCRKACAQ